MDACLLRSFDVSLVDPCGLLSLLMSEWDPRHTYREVSTDHHIPLRRHDSPDIFPEQRQRCPNVHPERDVTSSS